MTEPNEIDMSAADILPTTYLEEEWVRAVNSRASDHNLPLAIDITGPYDRGLVVDVLRALVLRHETLRMAFRPQRDGVQRAVWPTVEPVLDTVDLSGADERERIRRLNELILREAKRPTDLTRPPLWRAVEVRLAPAHHVLLTIWHHVIFDGWSSRVFFRDLTSLYAGALRRDQPKLPEPEIHLADYAAWERELNCRMPPQPTGAACCPENPRGYRWKTTAAIPRSWPADLTLSFRRTGSSGSRRSPATKA